MLQLMLVNEETKEELNIGQESAWKLKKNGLNGFGSLDRTINVSQNSLLNGGYFTGSHVSTRDRTISCAYMFPKNNAEERRRVISLLSHGGEFKLFIKNEEQEVWSECRLMRYEFNISGDNAKRMDLMMTFLFANPFWQSADDYGENIAEVIPLLAFPYLCSIDKKPIGVTGGAFKFSQIVKVFNGGDIETNFRAEMTAKDKVVNPIIYCNNHFVKLNDELKCGDKVVFDFAKVPATVRKNNANVIGMCDRRSELTDMELKIGENTLKFDADNGSDNLDVSIYYNEQFGAV